MQQHVHPREPGDRPDHDSGDDRINLTRFDRSVAAAGAGALLVFGLGDRGIIGRVLISGAGLWLMTQAMTGRCTLLEPMGIRVLHRAEGGRDDERIDCRETITIGQPRADVFRACRDRWRLGAGLGDSNWWGSQITRETTDEVICWRHEQEGRLMHVGCMRFEDAPAQRGTVIHAEIEYVPTAGAFGAVVAKALGRAPGAHIRADLRHLKQLLETGEIARIDGQPAGGRRPASRPQPTIDAPPTQRVADERATKTDPATGLGLVE